MGYKIPVLFVIFKRKDTSLKSFEQIKKVRPEQLYIACDGARFNVEGEAEMVEATRKAVLEAIDWDCEYTIPKIKSWMQHGRIYSYQLVV